jgi:hypothetical protein
MQTETGIRGGHWRSEESKMIRRTRVLILSCLLFAGGEGFAFSPDTKSFIEKHCAECHDAETKKAGLDLTALSYLPEDQSNFATWVKVHRDAAEKEGAT